MSEIVCSDALEYMESFMDNTFDLIVLDPDYQDWETLIQNGIIDTAMRLLKDTGNILCFTKQPFDWELRKAVNPWLRREIVWTFENGGAWCSAKMPLISTQKIYWLTKSKQFYFNPRTGVPYSGATKDFKRSSKVFGDYSAEGREFTKSEEGIWIRDHLHYNKPQSGKLPQKPQELIDILVRCFCPEAGNVLDPFTGGGTVCKSAVIQNKEVYACDNNMDRVSKVLDWYLSYGEEQ